MMKGLETKVGIMNAKLVAEKGNVKGLVLSFAPFEEGEQAIIGRDPDACQLLIEDPAVSRRHLMCHVTAEGLQLENLSATNPVAVNDQKLTEPLLLAHGDVVKVGGTTFRYSTDAAPHSLDEPATEEIIEEEVRALPAEEESVTPEASLASTAEKESPQQKRTTKEKARAPSEKSPEPEEEPYTASPRERRDTIFDEVSEEAEDLLAEIDFGLLETGRWLLKVINGPNNGAEFSMHAGGNYTIGTDPTSCDIIFHDTSVSRRHVHITVNNDESISIEDLNSRNGTLIDGERCEQRQELIPNSVITVGTTSFVVFDREGEMQTVIAPLLPSIVKVLQKDEAAAGEDAPAAANDETPEQEASPPEAEASSQSKEANTLTGFIIIAIVTGLFIIAGIGTVTLFQSEPIAVNTKVNSEVALIEALTPFPQVQYSFNKATGTLFMVGHVLTDTEKKQLIYNLQGLPFIKKIDESGIVIDEYVWQELNPLLARNPRWRGVSIQAPSPGSFVLSGYLNNRQDMEELGEYISSHFPYLDLLDNRVIVEEDLIRSIEETLANQSIRQVTVTISNGNLSLRGSIAKNQEKEFNTLVNEFKSTPGIRRVQDYVSELAPEKSMIDITDRYSVSGVSSRSGNLSVIVDGKIVSQGDQLDGMTITNITSDAIFLEKDGIKYRITLR